MRRCVLVCGSVLLVACGGGDAVTPGDDAGADAAADEGADSTLDGTSFDVGGDGAGEAGAGEAGDGASDGGLSCPPFHANCGGVCVYVGNDPKNCGACGVVCTPPAVCSAGGCTDKCMPGLTPCSGACVDLKTDSGNCGACGNKCGAGLACVDGTCKSGTTYPPPPKCADGSGPPISIDGAPKSPCAGDLAATSFTWALCSCTDVDFTGKVLVDGFDSTKGPYKPGELGAGVGANGRVRASSESDVWGQLWAASSASGVSTSSASTVHHDLRSGGPVQVSVMSAQRDAWVAGAVTGKLAVTNTLHISPGVSKGGATWGTLDDKTAVSVAPPCACGSKIPVGAIVAAHQTANDNVAVGLDPEVLSKPTHPDRIDLPCGHYYLKGFSLKTAAAIYVTGRAAIYVDGDVDAGGAFAIALGPKGELDLFVSGTIRASSSLRLGNPNAPALTRIYVGGAADLEVKSTLLVAGNLWAGDAKVIWNSETDFFGSIFAGNFESKSPFQIHYDRAVVKKGDDCPKLPPPPPPPDGGTVDAPSETGGPGLCGRAKTACSSCSECGNQACLGGSCGNACTKDADCCAPLVCSGGCCVSPIK